LREIETDPLRKTKRKTEKHIKFWRREIQLLLLPLIICHGNGTLTSWTTDASVNPKWNLKTKIYTKITACHRDRAGKEQGTNIIRKTIWSQQR
jgi:hypothetical protein